MKKVFMILLIIVLAVGVLFGAGQLRKQSKVSSATRNRAEWNGVSNLFDESYNSFKTNVSTESNTAEKEETDEKGTDSSAGNEEKSVDLGAGGF